MMKIGAQKAYERRQSHSKVQAAHQQNILKE
jgi:hypothetical protein